MTATATRRRLTGLALLVAASLTLAGCGTPSAGAAAVVGDRRISVADLQNATADLTILTKAQDETATVSQEKVLQFLILGPDLVTAAARAGVGVSEDTIRQQLAANQVAHPHQSTVDAMRALAALNILNQANKTDELKAVVTGMRAKKVEVNPRYGAFDAASLSIVAGSDNWLAGDPSPSLPGLGGSDSGAGDGTGDGSGSAPQPTATP